MGNTALGASSLMGGRAATATAQGGAAGNVAAMQLGQNVRVMADRINNTLLIHASPAEYARIEGTLKRLDIQRAQVLIEASIVEVTLGDGLEYGLQWAFGGGVGGGYRGSGVLNNATGSNSAISFADGATRYALGSAAGTGFSYALSNAAGNVTAMLQALASKSLLKVISSPSLMVLDNHTAAIQVGNQQPINVGTTISTSGNLATTNNIQYKDTGVMLGVTPSVNAGDLVTLDISQSVTDLDSAAKSATSGYPTFLQRQIESKVAVRSGETLVLGGLIKDSNSSSKSGLPVLSSIPILGAMFGRHSNTTDRTELLVILTPRVLRSDDDARAVSRELRQRMQGLTLDTAAPAPRQ
ncbi:MAG: secretin N-terminal domain-containing protein [Pseudomonadota bacterium]|nr:secretin N-terminal domain-containing protein [Pseudomonadota bacterium]